MTVSSEWLNGAAPGAQGRRKWLGAGLLIVILVFGSGLVVGSRVGNSDPGGDRSSGGSITGQPDSGPTSSLNGVPVGFAQTKEGALAAAQSFLKVGSSSLVTEGSNYVQAMSTMAAPEWRERAEEMGANGNAFFVERYGSDGSLVASPMASKVVEFRPSSARVLLWSASLASGSKRPAGEQAWSVTTLDLRWVGADWRISHQVTSSSPPPPVMNGQTPASVEHVIKEFRRG